jgi:hypothetical protein
MQDVSQCGLTQAPAEPKRTPAAFSPNFEGARWRVGYTVGFDYAPNITLATLHMALLLGTCKAGGSPEFAPAPLVPRP